MDNIGDLSVRISADTGRFAAGMNRTQQQFNRSASAIEGRARQLDTRLASTGSRFGGGMTQAIQQAGFQVGDFAVQVASGQSALRAFIQQGTQLAGAFGPVGAVLGAVGAVVGALVQGLIDTGDEADTASGAAGNLADSMNVLADAGAAVDDLNARIQRSSGQVRAALIQERDATVDLLKARLALAQENLANRRSQIRAEAASEAVFAAGGRRGQVQAQRKRLAGPDGGAIIQQVEADFLESNPAVRVELAALESQIAQTEAGLGKLASGTTSPVFSGGGGRSRRRGGGSGRGTSTDAFAASAERTRERIAALENERKQIGLTEAEAERLSAAFDREKLVRELVNAAQKDGTAATPEEIAQARELAAQTEALTIAIFDEKEAIEAANDAAKQAKKDQDDLAKSISSTGDKFINAVKSAESFEDALKNIGLQLLELAANAALGQGPLGGLFNDLIGVGSGGVVGLLGGGSSPVASASPFSATGGLFAKGGAFSGGRQITPFAKGGVVNGPTMFPMANGAGLMGEAGPEAILPLKKGANGSLGVNASGIGGNTIVVSPTYNISGLGLSGPEVQSLMERNNRDIVGTINDRLDRNN